MAKRRESFWGWLETGSRGLVLLAICVSFIYLIQTRSRWVPPSSNPLAFPPTECLDPRIRPEPSPTVTPSPPSTPPAQTPATDSSVKAKPPKKEKSSSPAKAEPSPSVKADATKPPPSSSEAPKTVEKASEEKKSDKTSERVPPSSPPNPPSATSTVSPLPSPEKTPTPPPSEKGRAEAPPSQPIPGAYLVIYLGRKTLALCAGQEYLRVWRGIGVPQNPSPKTRKGDGCAPIGTYRICAKLTSSRGKLLRLDYPNLADAKRAREEGRIEEATFRAIEAAHRARQYPPPHTPLGGPISITGDRASQESSDGDIAIPAEAMEELWNILPVGTVVRILP